jgi:hypothetical protein
MPLLGVFFWVHHAARIRFKRVVERLFLTVEPLYLFTSDGAIAVTGKSAGKLALLWGGRQQNPDILRNLLFWGAVLARNESAIRIATGSEPIVLSPIPASALLDRGIAFDEVRIKALLSKDDSDLDRAVLDAQMAETEQEDGEEGDENTRIE